MQPNIASVIVVITFGYFELIQKKNSVHLF